MYSSFKINNFRCFSDLAFEPLEQINLIAGKNNVGKTALLEAIWMRHGYQNPELGLRVDIFRGLAAFKNEEITSTASLITSEPYIPCPIDFQASM